MTSEQRTRARQALARLPYRIVDDLLGDLLFESYPRALAMGERDAARLRGQPRPSFEPTMTGAVVHAAADIASERLRGTVLTWFEENLIDPRSINRAAFEHEIEMPLAHRRDERRRRGLSQLRDPQTEIGWWAGYHEELSPSNAKNGSCVEDHRARHAKDGSQRSLSLRQRTQVQEVSRCNLSLGGMSPGGTMAFHRGQARVRNAPTKKSISTRTLGVRCLREG